MLSHKPSFILHAPNVYCGGGFSLLKALIDVLSSQSTVIIDDRLSIADSELSRFIVYRIKPTVDGRLKGELLLRKLATKDTKVLCFGNLPPLFKLKAQVHVFMQNRYLIEPCLPRTLPLSLYMRLSIERWWLKSCMHHCESLIVQTHSMASLIKRWTSKMVMVAPFMAYELNGISTESDSALKTQYDFAYVAYGEPHKNHKNLLLAWAALAKENFFPKLVLTLCPTLYPKLATEIAHLTEQHGLNIENLGLVGEEKVHDIYQQSKALIFPSFLESFGLPLLEAKTMGLKIVASELDYVRDLVDPDESFDPLSPLSIARAVKRAMCWDERKEILMSAATFLEKAVMS